MGDKLDYLTKVIKKNHLILYFKCNNVLGHFSYNFYIVSSFRNTI